MTTIKMNLAQMVGEQIYRRAGLHKLSHAEQDALARWIEDRLAQAIAQTKESLAQHGPAGPPPWPRKK